MAVSFQKTVTLTEDFRRRMARVRDRIRDLDLEAPAIIAGLNDTELARAVMALGLEALEKEHRLR